MHVSSHGQNRLTCSTSLCTNRTLYCYALAKSGEVGEKEERKNGCASIFFFSSRNILTWMSIELKEEDGEAFEGVCLHVMRQEKSE